MKKRLLPLILLCLFCFYSYSVSASNEETTETDECSYVYTDEELQKLLENALPISAPEKTDLSVQSNFNHNGCYVYDVETGEESFENFEIEKSIENANEISAYECHPSSTVEKISFSINDYTMGDRVAITDTLVPRYSSTVKLLIVGNKSEQVYVGTGFMIGPNSIAISGHCIYNDDLGGWAHIVTAIPAMNGKTLQPFGSDNSYQLVCGGEWKESYNNQDDWGIIRVRSNFGNKTGWLGLRWQTDSYNGETATSVGYPANGSDRMFYSIGIISESLPRTLVGNWASSGGVSGGPLQKYYSDTGYTVIGINRGKGVDYADCIRIDEWLYNKFMSYRTLSFGQ